MCLACVCLFGGVFFVAWVAVIVVGTRPPLLTDARCVGLDHTWFSICAGMLVTLERYDADNQGVAFEMLTILQAVNAKITVIFVQPRVVRWLLHLSSYNDMNYGKGYQWM